VVIAIHAGVSDGGVGRCAGSGCVVNSYNAGAGVVTVALVLSTMTLVVVITVEVEVVVVSSGRCGVNYLP